MPFSFLSTPIANGASDSKPNLAIPCAFAFPFQAQSRHTMRVRFAISIEISPYHAHSFFYLKPILAIPCAFALPSQSKSRHTMRIRFSISGPVSPYQSHSFSYLGGAISPFSLNCLISRARPSPFLIIHAHHLLMCLTSFRASYPMLWVQWVGGIIS